MLVCVARHVVRELTTYTFTPPTHPQPDTEINVGVPVPRPVKGSSMHLIVAEDALQMALIDDQSFGVIAGKFAGQIDPSTSGWRLGKRSAQLAALSLPINHIII